ITGVKMALDPEALQHLSAGPGTEITVRPAHRAKIKDVLKATLSPLHLTYRVDGETLWIGTPRMQCVVYSVADLVLPARDAIGPGPAGAEAASKADFPPLIELIPSTVAPGTWSDDRTPLRGARQASGQIAVEPPKPGDEAAGKPGSITPFFLNVSLVVRHT